MIHVLVVAERSLKNVVSEKEFIIKIIRYVPTYDREDKDSGGSSRTNRPANDVLSVLSCHCEVVCLLGRSERK